MVSLLDRAELFSLLVDYQASSGNPLGLTESELTSWARGLEFDGGSGTFIYTGGLYQMVPWINAFSAQLSRLESGHLPTGAALKVGKGLGLLGRGVVATLSGVSGSDIERSGRILRRASEILRGSGVPHGYMGVKEPYSGALFLEMGLDNEFGKLASAAYNLFRSAGVKRLITLDPHSTVALKEGYPRFVDGFDIEVSHYLELVRPQRAARAEGVSYSLHDPCLLARRLDLAGKLRECLGEASVNFLEPKRCGKGTFCCGGPIESVAPRVAGAIAESRCDQLRERSGRALVACPVCLANLGRVSNKKGIQVTDLLEAI